MPPLEPPRPIVSVLDGTPSPLHPSPSQTMLGLERLSVRELSYKGMQLGFDQPELIVPTGWGEWEALNPGEPVPPEAREVGKVAP